MAPLSGPSTTSSRCQRPTASGWRCAFRTCPSRGRWSWPRSLGRKRRLFLLCRARRAEDAAQPLVALVAGVLEDGVLVVAREPHAKGPRLHPGGRVVEGDRPFDRVLRRRPEPLDGLEPARRATERRFLEVVRAFDDERVAFPVAARVAHVRLHVPRERLAAVERDDARVVHHLVADRDHPWRLHDLVRVAVDGRHHRARDAAGDAPHVERQILRAVEGTGVIAVAAAARRADGGRALLRLVGRRRHLVVGRVLDHPGPAVGGVVILVPVLRTGAGILVLRAADDLGRLFRPCRALLDQRGKLLGLDVLQPASGELRRPLHRDAALVAVGVGALDVRVAPRRPRNRARLRAGDRGEERHRHSPADQCSNQRCHSKCSWSGTTKRCAPTKTSHPPYPPHPPYRGRVHNVTRPNRSYGREMCMPPATASGRPSPSRSPASTVLRCVGDEATSCRVNRCVPSFSSHARLAAFGSFQSALAVTITTSRSPSPSRSAACGLVAPCWLMIRCSTKRNCPIFSSHCTPCQGRLFGGAYSNASPFAYRISGSLSRSMSTTEIQLEPKSGLVEPQTRRGVNRPPPPLTKAQISSHSWLISVRMSCRPSPSTSAGTALIPPDSRCSTCIVKRHPPVFSSQLVSPSS